MKAEIDKIYQQIELGQSVCRRLLSAGRFPLQHHHLSTMAGGSMAAAISTLASISLAVGSTAKQIVGQQRRRVAFVNTNYTPGYSYGKYLMIDHVGGAMSYSMPTPVNPSEGRPDRSRVIPLLWSVLLVCPPGRICTLKFVIIRKPSIPSPC
jgi:hypothetical protein